MSFSQSRDSTLLVLISPLRRIRLLHTYSMAHWNQTGSISKSKTVIPKRLSDSLERWVALIIVPGPALSTVNNNGTPLQKLQRGHANRKCPGFLDGIQRWNLRQRRCDELERDRRAILCANI